MSRPGVGDLRGAWRLVRALDLPGPAVWEAAHRSGVGLNALVWLDVPAQDRADRLDTLAHPGVERVVAVDGDALITQARGGATLPDWLGAGPVRDDRWALVGALAELLGHAAERGVAHGGLTLDHVRIGPRRPLVLGFGQATRPDLEEADRAGLTAIARAALGADADAPARAALELLPSLPLTQVASAVRALRLASSLEHRPAIRPPPSSGPPPVRILGRAAELDAARRALDAGRLLTILGPGGIGKTTLLAALAAQTAGLWIELQDVSAAPDLVAVIASAVAAEVTSTGVAGSDAAALGRRLARRGPTILYLDNAEQIATELASVIQGLQRTAPELTVALTSRVLLGLPAEQVIILEPLGPAPAIALFRRAAPGTVGDDAGVLRVVDAVDRLPLGIELAASHAGVLSLDALASRLEGDVASRGLDGAIAWSWDALSSSAQHDLGQLGVFATAFELAAAEAVLGDDALDRLELLRRRSWLHRTGDRLGLYPTLREFVRARRPAPADAVAAHRRWVTGFARQQLEALCGPLGGEAEEALSAAVPELLLVDAPVARAAAVHGLSRRGDVPAVERLTDQWLVRPEAAPIAAARFVERFRRGDLRGAQLDLARMDPEGALLGRGRLAVRLGPLAEAETLLRGAERRLDPAERAWARLARARVLGRTGRLADALSLAEEASDALTRRGPPRWQVEAQLLLGELALGGGYGDLALAWFQSAACLGATWGLAAGVYGGLSAAVLQDVAPHDDVDTLLAAGRPDLAVRASWKTDATDRALDAAREAQDAWLLAVTVCWLRSRGALPTGAKAEARRALDALDWSAGRDWLAGGEAPPLPGIAPAAAIPEVLPTATERLVIEPTGAWFQIPGGDPIDVCRFRSARRILSALFAASTTGGALSLDDVIAAGWPGESIGFDSARNRAWVALSQLRKLGLDNLLVRDDRGYALLGDPTGPSLKPA